MRRILALIVAPAVVPAAETVQAVADYDGAHAASLPLGLVAVAAVFVVAGAWLIWLSSRSRG